MDTCSLGIETEMQLIEASKTQDKMIFTFVRPENKEVIIAEYMEVDTRNSHAFIKAAKSTLAPESMSWVKEK